MDTFINHIGGYDKDEESGTIRIMTRALSKEEYADYEINEFQDGISEIEIVIDWKIKNNFI